MGDSFCFEYIFFDGRMVYDTDVFDFEVNIMQFLDVKESACLFCGGNSSVMAVARDDGAALFAVCATCREKIVAAWTSSVTIQTERAQSYSDETKRVIAEALTMTEEAFEEKYLTDEVDRVVFEYVRGYGQTALDGGAMGLLSIMTEKNVEEIQIHIDGLIKNGLLYPVVGKLDWYGADYPFADD
jgi:hypothetical protein